MNFEHLKIQYERSFAISRGLCCVVEPFNHHVLPTLFQDITKCLKDDLKDDSAASVMQSVIKHGIERIELRDEILCQLIRQTNENSDDSSLIVGWLFLCLCTASFAPSKNLHKVGRAYFNFSNTFLA